MDPGFQREDKPLEELYLASGIQRLYAVDKFLVQKEQPNPAYLTSDLFVPPVLGKDLTLKKFKGITRQSRKELPREIREHSYRHVCIPNSIQFVGRAAFASSPGDDGPFLRMIGLDYISFQRNRCLLTRICAMAFQGANIMAIRIPHTVEVIEERAFMECRYLSQVSFDPESKLERLENQVFARTALSMFEIPKNVNFISVSAFSETKIRQMYVHKDNKNFVVDECLVFNYAKDRLVMCCSWSEEFVVPREIKGLGPACCEGKPMKFVFFDSDCLLTSIERLAFANTGILSIDIPKSVTEIGEAALAKCRSLTTVVFPEDTAVVKFGPFAFAETGLERISIPSTVRELADGCFADCLRLKSVEIDLAKTNLEVVGEKVFSNTAIESMVVPSKVKSLGAMCFYKCASLTQVTFQEPVQIDTFEPYLFAWSGIVKFEIPKEIKVVKNAVFAQCDSLTEFVFPDDSQLRVLDDYAFSNQPADARLLPESKKSFMKLRLPASLETMGTACFLHLKSLGQVTFAPNARLTEVPEYAFGFSCIKDVVVPSMVQKIGKFALSDCSIERVTFESPAHVTEFCLCAFQNSYLTAIDIPASVKTIAPICFGGCDKLTSITFAENAELTDVGDAAFSLAHMKTITLPRNLEAVGKKNFYCCWALEEVNFAPGSVLKRVREMAFEMSSLQKITFPPTLEEIERGCFWRCASIKTVIFESPAIVSRFGPKMFWHSAIFSMKIPSSVKYLNKSCFAGSANLTTIEIDEDSQLERIDEYAFRNSGLKSLHVPKSVSYIGGGCFAGCPDSFTLDISPNNTHLKLRDNILLSADGQTLLTIVGPATQLVVPTGVRIIGTSAFAASKLAAVTFEQPVVVEEIGRSAFRNNSVQKLEVPASVKRIKAKCFCGTERTKNFLGEITFGTNSQLNELGDKVFQWSSLREISLPPSIETIGAGAFEGCRLSRLNYEAPSKLATVADGAFSKCSLMELTGDENAVQLTHSNMDNGKFTSENEDDPDSLPNPFGSETSKSEWTTGSDLEWGRSSGFSSDSGWGSSGGGDFGGFSYKDDF